MKSWVVFFENMSQIGYDVNHAVSNYIYIFSFLASCIRHGFLEQSRTRPLPIPCFRPVFIFTNDGLFSPVSSQKPSATKVVRSSSWEVFDYFARLCFVVISCLPPNCRNRFSFLQVMHLKFSYVGFTRSLHTSGTCVR